MSKGFHFWRNGFGCRNGVHWATDDPVHVLVNCDDCEFYLDDYRRQAENHQAVINHVKETGHSVRIEYGVIASYGPDN